MNVLFITPINFRCRDVESLLIELQKSGNRVFMYSFSEAGELIRSLDNTGIITGTYKNYNSSGQWGLIKRIFWLVTFCRKNNIDLLLSHLEPTNFLAIVSQYFVRAKVIIFRHHTNFARLSNFDQSIAYKATYNLAKNIVCVSRQAMDYVVEVEKINRDKVAHIDLGYDFNRYQIPSQSEVKEFRNNINSALVLITVGRLDEFKRPELSLYVLDKLVHHYHLDVKLIYLGSGSRLELLQKLAHQLNLEARVNFLGFIHEPLIAMAASDYLLHPSISEASSVVVKESSLVNLPVVVCRSVGDFDDYLSSENAYLVDPSEFIEQSTELIVHNQRNTADYQMKSHHLKSTILERFSIERTFPKFLEVVQRLR